MRINLEYGAVETRESRPPELIEIDLQFCIENRYWKDYGDIMPIYLGDTWVRWI